MTTDLLILKGVLLLRKSGNKYQTKEEQLEEQRDWFNKGYTDSDSLNAWIMDLQEELRKTPEQREAESREFIDYLCQAELADLMEDHYTPSATAGDYGPSCPWNAPGMSIKDFI